MIIIKRASAWGDQVRNYKIFLDGEVIGEIADGSEFSHNVSIGDHSLFLKIDYAKSPKINFHVKENKELVFKCSPNITGFKILLLPLYLTILSNRYIKLEMQK